MDGISTFSALLSAGRNPGHVHWLSLSNAERHGSLSQPSDLGECPLSIAEGLPKAISMQEAFLCQALQHMQSCTRARPRAWTLAWVCWLGDG